VPVAGIFQVKEIRAYPMATRKAETKNCTVTKPERKESLQIVMKEKRDRDT
jgi:hypothetical protein